MYQDFFNITTLHLIQPLIQKLPEFDLSKIIPNMNGTLPISDIISVEYNLTDFAFEYGDYNGSVSIAAIEDNSVTFQMNNLTINLTLNYAYVSDPPIFADIGAAYIGVDTMNFTFEISSDLVDDDLKVTLTDLYLNFSDPHPNVVFEGLSDFSELATGLVTTLTTVIRNRLKSFINSGDLTAKINNITNAVIDLVPEQVSLGDTGLYLDSWLYSNPYANATEGIFQVPLKTVIATDVAEYQEECSMKELPRTD